MTERLQADYLIVGSGAMGLAIADVLFHETDATMVIVDRHQAPGGHWNDAYPFVRLHQPSAYYGVNSRELGGDARDHSPLNPGMGERATGAELLAYYWALMRDLVASGRVQYFPMCDYVGDFDATHSIRSLLSGESHEVKVRRKIVDSTYFRTAVPSTHPPKYAVAEGLRCVPLNELPRVKQPPSGYTVVGAGKTGIDAVLWLLENKVPPAMIRWIMPRDSWFQNRANVQSGDDFFMPSFTAFATQMEIAATANSVDELFARLEASEQLLRFDAAVQPRMYHGALVSTQELEALRAIKDIVRLGRVQRIERDRIVLAQGEVAAHPDALYVDCSASAVETRPPVPVFAGRRITAQMIRTFQPTFSAAFIGHLEATRPDDDAGKNKLCAVIPMPDAPIQWLVMLLVNMGNQHRWTRDPELRDWISHSRLDRFSGMARGVAAVDVQKLQLLQRFARAAQAAAVNAQRLLAA